MINTSEAECRSTLQWIPAPLLGKQDHCRDCGRFDCPLFAPVPNASLCFEAPARPLSVLDDDCRIATVNRESPSVFDAVDLNQPRLLLAQCHAATLASRGRCLARCARLPVSVSLRVLRQM